MPAGRPKQADPGTLYAFAHDFYWQLRRIVEGFFHWRFDEEEYNRLAAEIDAEKIHLSDDQNVALAKAFAREVGEGRVTEAEKEPRLRQMAADNLWVTRDWLKTEASQVSKRQVKVPGKPEVMQALLQARTPEEVRTICKDAFVPRIIQIEPGITKEVIVPNWPIPAGSVLPRYLSEYASEFLAAKSDPRFPKSTKRPSSELKQLWFLSRALAGALYGVTTRTAINLVGSRRPEEVFEGSRAAKPFRKRVKQRKAAGRGKSSGYLKEF